MLFVMTDEFSVRFTKVTSRIGVSWTHNLLFWFWPLFSDKFESHNFLKLSFTNIWGLCSNSVECESFLNQTLLTFLLYARQTWMTQLILAILCERLSSFNSKRFCYLYAWSCSLCETRTSFYMGLICRI